SAAYIGSIHLRAPLIAALRASSRVSCLVLFHCHRLVRYAVRNDMPPPIRTPASEAAATTSGIHHGGTGWVCIGLAGGMYNEKGGKPESLPLFVLKRRPDSARHIAPSLFHCRELISKPPKLTSCLIKGCDVVCDITRLKCTELHRIAGSRASAVIRSEVFEGVGVVCYSVLLSAHQV